MPFLLNIINAIKNFFCIPQAPVGLRAMGIRAKYLDKVYGFNYSANRFYTDILSPVDMPYFFGKQHQG